MQNNMEKNWVMDEHNGGVTTGWMEWFGDFFLFFFSGSTCLTISVLSLQGVEPASLSPSSWTIMVFTDSVSPLLSLEELQRSGGDIQPSLCW